mgnify:FL=1
MSKRKLSVLFVLGFLMIVCVFLGIGLFSSRSSESVTASAAIGTCSCPVKKPETHRIEPTCTTAGSSYTTCGNCGLRIGGSITLDALGHNYEWVVDREATCSAEGSRSEKCTRCGEIRATESIDKIAHTSDMITHVTQATCTKSGSSYELCTVCNAKINVKSLPALGHSFMWVTTTEPTCTETGIRTQECTRCHIAGEMESIAATGHTSDMTQHVEAATCTKSGSSYELCTVCNAKINVKSLPALGHGYGWVTTTEATCTADGVDSYVCLRCYDVAETRSIPALGHDYEWVIDKEASCSVDGLRHQECTRCHAKMTQETYRDEHVPGIAEPVAPTCTTAGYTIYRCTYCGAVCSRGNPVPALGHAYNIDIPTCTVSMECTRCGLTIKPALGHDTHPCVDETCGKCGEMVAATEYHAWGEWQLVRQATATQEGEKMRTCGVCGGAQTQTIPKTGGSGENTGGSGGSGGSDKDPGGSDGGAGGGGSGSWTDSLLPGVSDSMKVIIAAGAGVLLFAVGIGIYFAISGKRRKRR